MDNGKEKVIDLSKENDNKYDYDVQNDQHNVSFSFNLDLDNISEDLYSNSDAELEIDVSEIDNNETPNNLKKRKREKMDKDISVFNQMEEEIERQLDAKAARTNLTAKNVKNILKHVITNEHVMAMVKRRAYNMEDDIVFEPKLTRAKAKELAMSQPDIPWPITPVKKLKGSEVQVLIEEELPEDSSDEEYHPGQDEPSDDDREIENSVSSDIDSQPSTPATASDIYLTIDEPQLQIVDVQYDDEGVFKVPEIPTNFPITESENIGQRTRSKFSLSETPLEQIEQAFIPPDITTDMYDWGWDADEDWNNFLKEFTQPLTQEINGDDDPEADPEYNILEDEESENLLDKEELRMDKAVKVTRKELNNLVAELFEFADMFSRDDDQDVIKKKKASETMNTSIENTSINGSVIELLPVLAESNLPKLVNAEQRLLLDVQLSQHVQLMSQHFVMTYMHPELHNESKICKDNLNSLKYLSNGENSAFNALNLPDALELVSHWENKFQDQEEFRDNYTDFVSEENSLGKIAIKQKEKFVPKFHPEIKKMFLESKALMYPQLLPEIPFRCCLNKNIHVRYPISEDNLIVLGLEQFFPFVNSKKTRFKSKSMQLIDVAQLITQYLVPNRDPQRIVKHINISRSSPKHNPIKDFFKTEKVSPLIHCILEITKADVKSPKEQPFNILPKEWQKILEGVEDPSNEAIRKRMLRIYKNLIEPSKLDVNSNLKPDLIPPNQNIDHNLLNPTINMLPTMPFLNTPLKSATRSGKSENNLKSTNKSLQKLSLSTETEGLLNIQAFQSPSRSEKLQENQTPIAEENNKLIEFEYQPENRNEILELSNESQNISKDPITVNPDTNSDEDNPEEAKNNSTDNISETNMLLSPNTMSDCASPKKMTEFEQAGGDISIKDIEQREESTKEEEEETAMDKPQLRKTTPRLAKIRSAQNMKMMAQILGNKGPSVNTAGVKPKGKKGGGKNSQEPSTSSKGDNEEEIAELMLASTTIKKDTAIRKRAKQARELENIKRLLEAENDLSQEERATKFAVSFLHKLHKALDPNAEIFKSIVKLFLDYNERIDSLNQTESEELCESERLIEEKTVCLSVVDDRPSTSQVFVESIEPKETNKTSKDTLTINLYKGVCERLTDCPELRSDFLLFLKPHQAAMIGKSIEHTMLEKMDAFVNIAQIYFAKQPSRLSKVMQAITQLASDTRVTLEKVNSVMGPLLKGHPLVMERFLQVLPNGKPPESLFAPHMFENLTCPPGPNDKTKIYAYDAPELYENIEIPVPNSNEDPYGGDNCKCECHNLEDHNLKSRNEHCVSCGTRFLNGRIYLQTSEGLRPAKITFPGGDDEKQEHITRVSLKTVEKIVPATPTRRRKSSKNSPDQTETKLNSNNKNSPIKDSELEMDNKILIKSKKMNKIATMKSKESKKSPKNIEMEAKVSIGNDNGGEKKGAQQSPVKTKREERAEKREAQDISRLKQSKIGFKSSNKSSKTRDSDNIDNPIQSQADDTSQDENSTSEYCRGDDIEEENELSTNESNTEGNMSLEKMDVSSDSGSEPGQEIESESNIRPWTRQEDAVLLECVKKDYSENTFLMISEALGDRTVQQVKERFDILLSLLERMA